MNNEEIELTCTVKNRVELTTKGDIDLIMTIKIGDNEAIKVKQTMYAFWLSKIKREDLIDECTREMCVDMALLIHEKMGVAQIYKDSVVAHRVIR